MTISKLTDWLTDTNLVNKHYLKTDDNGILTFGEPNIKSPKEMKKVAEKQSHSGIRWYP